MSPYRRGRKLSPLTYQEAVIFQSEKLSVPVDFTEESERSLKYVLAFAKEISAQFVVLQVVEKDVRNIR